MLLIAAGAMAANVARGQATPSTQNAPAGAPGQTAGNGPVTGQQTTQQAVQQTPQAQAGQQAQQMANEDALGAKFGAAAQGQEGVRVISVVANSPAGQAGLQADDRVISADGRPFKKGRHLEAYLSAQTGRPVPLVVDRNGRQSTIEIVPVPVQAAHGWLGVLLQEPGPRGNAQAGQNGPNTQNGHREQHATKGQKNDATRGAEVAEIAPDGPAARAGLRQGDIIVQVNGQEIDDAAELVADIHEMKPQTKVEFTVLRENQEQKIPVTLGNRNDEFAEGQGQPGPGQFGPGQFGGPFPGQMPPRQFPGGPFGGGQEFANQNNGQQMHQQLMEQNQRIEQELKQLREEVKQLREQLQKK
jgi:membrane-associated protease RseP (regulator of RpoE activity)